MCGCIVCLCVLCEHVYTCVEGRGQLQVFLSYADWPCKPQGFMFTSPFTRILSVYDHYSCHFYKSFGDQIKSLEFYVGSGDQSEVI